MPLESRRALIRTAAVAAVAAVLALPHATAAQGIDTRPATFAQIETRSYDFVEAGQEMVYDLFVPGSYDPAEATPLLVLLHGLGSSPAAVIRYRGFTVLAEERGYIIVAPMGFNSRGWYGSRGPGRASTRGDAEFDPENLGELSELDVMNVLALTLEEFNIDRDRVFLAGHSMGGGGTWHLALTYPDIWAGLGPVAPAIYSSPDALEAISHLPVIVIQGEDDNLVPVAGTRRWVEKMAELGMTHRYIEIPGGDHTRIISQTPDNVRAIFDFFEEHGGR